MSVYKTNRVKAKTFNNEPTMTDQSQAAETDLNIIMKQFLKTGTVPGASGEPMYEDFTELPNDLRGMIELSRTMREQRRNLPEQIRHLPVEDLLGLTPDKWNAIMKPAEQPKEETKA